MSFDNPSIDIHYKALIKSQSERGPNTLLTARHSKYSDIYFHNDSYTSMCRYRLGEIYFPGASNHQIDAIPCAESRCHEFNNQFGVHCLHCKAGEHNAVNRHNNTIAKLLLNYCRRAGLNGAREPRVLIPGGFRPDFICDEFKGGKRFMFDVTFLNTCAETYKHIVVNNTVDKALLTEHNRKLNEPQNRAFGNLRN